MTLLNMHSKSKLIKRFMGLGPYLREGQCTGEKFFFDCLAVCVSAKPAPEKREFWGWWLELKAEETGFTYVYHYGLYNKLGHWQKESIKDAEVMMKLETTLNDFHLRLNKLLKEMELTLSPVETPEEKAVSLS